jgi:signal transduction histidine kinase
MPEPRQPGWHQLMTGSEDVLWVELRGVVRQATTNSLSLAMRDGLVNVRVADASPEWMASLEGAVIRMQGCPFPIHNSQRQLLGVFLHVPAPEFISVEVPAPAHPFSGPRVPVAGLMRFDPKATILSQRVTVTGQLTYQDGTTCFLEDSGNSLKLILDEPAELKSGDLVQVVGFPEYGIASPVLQHAVARRIGNAPLPAPVLCDLTNLLSGAHDSSRIRAQGRLVSARLHAEGGTLLELEMGSRLIPVRLTVASRRIVALPPGSLLEVTGICHGLSRAVLPGSPDNVLVLPRLNSFELLTDSAADLRLLARPSWWTLSRAVSAAGVLALVLLASLLWIAMLRRRVEARTQDLREEVQSHRLTVEQLNQEIEGRKRAQYEVEQVQQALVKASRQAGMAEMAAGVLHNVGNVLNSVNVSSTVVIDRLREMQLSSLDHLGELLAQHKHDLPQFLAQDPRGRQVPDFIAKLAVYLNTERTALQEEVQQLRRSVEHIKEIVVAQQSHAKRSGFLERLEAADLVAEALRLQEASFAKHGIRVEQNAETVLPVWVDRHKVIQILVNLLMNARQAYDGISRPDKKVTVNIRQAAEDKIRIEVADEGVGIPDENLPLIFSHGFTTRADGHGFGLHSGALAAQEMGGSLTASSDGPGQGAVFSLMLPVKA